MITNSEIRNVISMTYEEAMRELLIGGCSMLAMITAWFTFTL